MIVNIDGIPVYNAELDGDDTGMCCISLVEYPAVLRDFQKLSAHERQKRESTRQLYAIADEERQLVRGVVMRADFPIYRQDNNRKYYLIYKADTIRQMAEKYLADNLQNVVNLAHEEGAYVEGVQMVQWYLKDTAAGIAPEGFEDCADGSLFAEFHVTDPDIWAAIKEGTYKGFSLEGYFALTPEEDRDEVERIVEETRGLFSQIFNAKNMSIAKFKALFAKLVKMRTATSDKGVIAWDGDDDLKVGDELFVEDEGGNRTAAPADVYTLTDGTAVTVAEGKVTDIVAPGTQSFGEVDTDKGRIRWDGDEDLRAGDTVYRIDEEGNRSEVEDGEYTTPDGKVITVADGKVASITDPAAEVEAKRQERMALVQKHEASYDEKYRAIRDALASLIKEEFYVMDAGDDFAIVDTWSPLDYVDRYFRYPIRVSEDATVTVEGDPVEVKEMWVPLDFVSPFESNEAEALRQENARLSAELEDLRRQPAAPSAHKAAKMAAESKITKRERLARLVR